MGGFYIFVMVIIVFSIYLFVEWVKWRRKDRILEQQIKELERKLNGDDAD